jgi:hypothetical protein
VTGAMKIAKNEYVLAAWAEVARGPGWANEPVLVLVGRMGGGEYRIEYLQPDEQSSTMLTLHRVSALVTADMTREAAMLLKERKT